MENSPKQFNHPSPENFYIDLGPPILVDYYCLLVTSIVLLSNTKGVN